MHRKIRLIATLFTILSLSIIISISLPLAIYAATSANINGSGNLSVIDVETQIDDLEALGFNCSGSHQDIYFNMQEMEKPTEDNIKIYREKAQNSNFLRYYLAKKIDCYSMETIYELRIVLDFSNQPILEYAANCIGYYNDIVFSSHTETLNISNFYTGEILARNINVTFDSNGASFIYDNQTYRLGNQTGNETLNFTYSYQIIINSFEYEGNYTELRNHTFQLIDDGTTISKVQTPYVTYIDISKTNIYLDDSGIHGISFRNNDYDGIQLTNNNHIHILGSTNEQLGAGLYITSLYVSERNSSLNEENRFKISVYKQISQNAYKILCKVEYLASNSIIINVIDDKYYNNVNELAKEQKESLLNMCYWLEKNNLEQVISYTLYHQLVNENMSFGSKYEVIYVEDSSKGDNWYKVTYTDNTLIGYFNSITHEIAFE